MTVTIGGLNSSSSSVEKPPLVSPKEIEAGTRRAMATIEDDDERLLARIGYKQVLTKHTLMTVLAAS